eukprot:1092204-Prymnesium_polylepis.1
MGLPPRLGQPEPQERHALPAQLEHCLPLVADHVRAAARLAAAADAAGRGDRRPEHAARGGDAACARLRLAAPDRRHRARLWHRVAEPRADRHTQPAAHAAAARPRPRAPLGEPLALRRGERAGAQAAAGARGADRGRRAPAQVPAAHAAQRGRVRVDRRG